MRWRHLRLERIQLLRGGVGSRVWARGGGRRRGGRRRLVAGGRGLLERGLRAVDPLQKRRECLIRRLLLLRGVVELGAQIRDLFRSRVRRVLPRLLRRLGILLRGGELALEVVERLRGVPLLHLGSGKILFSGIGGLGCVRRGLLSLQQRRRRLIARRPRLGRGGLGCVELLLKVHNGPLACRQLLLGRLLRRGGVNLLLPQRSICVLGVL